MTLVPAPCNKPLTLRPSEGPSLSFDRLATDAAQPAHPEPVEGPEPLEAPECVDEAALSLREGQAQHERLKYASTLSPGGHRALQHDLPA